MAGNSRQAGVGNSLQALREKREGILLRQALVLIEKNRKGENSPPASTTETHFADKKRYPACAHDEDSRNRGSHQKIAAQRGDEKHLPE